MNGWLFSNYVALSEYIAFKLSQWIFFEKKKHLERAIVWMYLQPHYDNGILEMFTFQLDNSKNTLGHCFTAKRPEIYFPTFSACFESQYFLQFGFWLF